MFTLKRSPTESMKLFKGFKGSNANVKKSAPAPTPAPAPAPARAQQAPTPAPIKAADVATATEVLEEMEDAMTRLAKSGVVVERGYEKPIDLAAYDFTSTDAHAHKCPKSTAAAIPSLANYLTSPFSDPVHKYRAIFTWITATIVYDVPGYLDNKKHSQEVEDVLRSHIAVCQGYANLFQALCEASGLNSSIVYGFCKGVNSQPGDGQEIERDSDGKPTGHAWNAVLVNHQFLLMDTTWGAGSIDHARRAFTRRFQETYFLVSPNKLIYSHYPGEAKDQYLSPPISEQDFLELPWVKPLYHEYQVHILKPRPRGPVIHTKDDLVDIYLEIANLPKGGSMVGQLVRFGADGKAAEEIQGAVIAQKAPGYLHNNVFWIHAVCPSKGHFRLDLVVVKGPNQPGLSFLATRIINNGHGTHSPAPKSFITPMPITIRSPLEGTIKASQGAVRFNISAFAKGDAAPSKFLLLNKDQSERREINKVAQDQESTRYEAEIQLSKKGDYTLYYMMGAGGSMPGVAAFKVV